ncbi:MAG: Hsp20/alpha crystallin family protein [Acidimicrobiia bacterium]
MVLRFMDPFEELEQFLGARGSGWRGGLMPMDAYEKDGKYTLKFDLPGVDPDHVDLMVENNVLTVKAERMLEDTEGANWLLRERPTSTHSRQVRLGERLDTGSLNATYDQGVLTVTLPMREESKPRRVAIEHGAHKAITVESGS